MDFEKIVSASRGRGRVFPIEADGTRYWVKFARKNYPNLLAKILGGFARHVGSASVQHEIDALNALRRRGMKTPDVVFSNQYYFVLTDIGPTIFELLKTASAQEGRRISLETGKAIRQLHHAGGWHGGARIYNMTMQNGEIGFIDLENTVDTWLPLGGRRLWDVWQLAHSLGYFDPEGYLGAAALVGYGPGWANWDLQLLAKIFIGLYLVLKPFQRHLKAELSQAIAVFRAVFIAAPDLRRR